MSYDDHDDEPFDPENPVCPQCGGDMYDNRADNRQHPEKRRPDFRCKSDREHVIWPPREKKAGKGGAKGKPSSAKQAYSSGDLPGDPAPAPTPAAAPVAPSPLSPDKLKEAEQARTARICGNMRTAIDFFGHKEKGMLKKMDELDMGYTPETVQCLVTSLFIALNDGRVP